MEIEKTMVAAAPINRVWDLLLDPKVMAGCIPGVQSVQVLNDTEYLAKIQVKISFISANFKIKTKILETRPPHYLLCEGAGEDSSVASSLKQTSEMFLTEQPGGNTEIRIKSKADVFGRLGSFGLSVMKTKADRMWDEFGVNVAAVLRQGQESIDINPVPAPLHASGRDALRADVTAADRSRVASQRSSEPHASAVPNPNNQIKLAKSKWWKRIAGFSDQDADTVRELRLPTDIYIELHRGNDVIKVLWPASAPAEVTLWLKEFIRQ